MELTKPSLRKTKKVLPEEKQTSENAVVSFVKNTQWDFQVSSYHWHSFWLLRFDIQNVHGDKC